MCLSPYSVDCHQAKYHAVAQLLMSMETWLEDPEAPQCHWENDSHTKPQSHPGLYSAGRRSHNGWTAEEEGGFQQGLSDCDELAGADRGVPDYAEGVEDFDDEGQEAEGGEGAAGVDGCEVRDVVEDAAEDVVVGEFEDGAGMG